MSKYGSLYDAYRLENSRAIPLYQGSTAPEALQVAQYNQGLYDTAQTGAFGIGNGLQSVTSLPQDKAMADQLRSNIQNKLSQFAKAGDYENMVPQVQQLGVEFSNRFRELQAPMQQRAEYQKELDNKDYNLTSDQKAGLLAMSDTGYGGLKKDEYGRLVGKYTGAGYDKNIDINKWVDERMDKIAYDEGGTEIANDNGTWKVKSGTEWKKLDPGKIENVLRSAMANSPEYLGTRNMIGSIAGFKGSRLSVKDIPDTIISKDAIGKSVETANPIKQKIQELISRGMSEKEALGHFSRAITEDNIDNNALNYARSKYAMNNVKTKSEHGIGEFQVKDYEHQLKGGNGPGIFGDLVTGQGIDLSQKYGDASDLDTKLSNSTAAITASNEYLDGQKARVARATGVKPTGKNGNYVKADLDKISNDQIGAWYNSHDPNEIGRFQSNLGIVNGSHDQLSEMNQIRDAAMEASVKKITGGQQTFSQLKDAATADMRKRVGDHTLSLVAQSTKDGNRLIKVKGDDLNNFEVISNTEARNKKTGTIYKTIVGQQLTDKYTGIDWKAGYKENVAGLRSNMEWMPLLNKTTPDGEMTKAGAYAMRAEGLLSTAAGSGAVRLTDNNDISLSKDDENNYKSLIAAGQYKLLGIGTDPKTGQRRAMVNVVVNKDASDPSDRYKTLMVGADSNFWDRMASSVQQTASKDLNSKDQAARAAAIKDLQFGMGMATGSGYSNVGSMMAGHSRTIKNASGQSEMKVVASPTGDGSNALMYYLYKTKPDGTLTTEPPISFNSSLDLGAYLDMQRADGKIITK